MTSCEHCEAVRARQADIAWGGQPMTPAMGFPKRYWTPEGAPSPGPFDADPGPCPCSCHDVWRLFQR